MALRRLSGTCQAGGGGCYDGDTCPTTYQKDHDTVIVQGYIRASERRPGGYSSVEVPGQILIEAARQLGRPTTETVTRQVIVTGVTVPPAELDTPDGETAVTITVTALLDIVEGLTADAA
jgi:hypothetical protein